MNVLLTYQIPVSKVLATVSFRAHWKEAYGLFPFFPLVLETHHVQGFSADMSVGRVKLSFSKESTFVVTNLGFG